MPAERFFLEDFFKPGHIARLQDREFHHLCHVMRAEVGDILELINGKNQLAEAQLTIINRSYAELNILNVQEQKKDLSSIILAQAIPRFNRLEFILEKGTELGVNTFWLFASEFSEKISFSLNQHARIRQILIAALKQCGRLDLPEIIISSALSKLPYTEGTILFGDTRKAASSLLELWKGSFVFKKPLTCIIGPEKGFSQNEIDLLENHFHAIGIKLHSNILRVDTAPLVALSQIQPFLSN